MESGHATQWAIGAGSKSGAPRRRSAAWLPLLWVALCLLLIAILHRDALVLGFEDDDRDFVRALKDPGSASLGQLWGTHWGWFYRPVFLTYFTLLLRVWGENPLPFHVSSLLLHSFNVVLLGWLVHLITRNQGAGILAGLLFIVNPWKQEAVSWISAASVLLAAFFYLATLHLWLAWRRDGRWLWFAGALVTFWLALCSKEDALSLPVVLLFIEYLLPTEKAGRLRWKWAIPFVGPTIGYCVLSVLSYQWLAEHPRFDWIAFSISNRGVRPLVIFDFFGRIFCSFIDIPLQFIPDCTGGECGPFELLKGFSARAGLLLGLLTTIGVGAAALKFGKPGREGMTLRFSWWWAVAAVAPVSLLIGDLPTILSWSRFYYMPAMPVAVLWTCLLQHLITKKPAPNSQSGGPI